MLRASREEAHTDPLTGLGNRRALTRDLARRGGGAPRAEAPLVLVLFDLDGFKHYNDTFGHPAGDALLVRLGVSLRRCLGADGRAFRMGGDEFCALIVAAPTARSASSSRRGRRCPSAARASSSARPTAPSRCRARRPTPRRPCGSPTSACTRRRRPAGRRPAARARTCSCARSPSAIPTWATTPARSPTWPRRPRAGSASPPRRSTTSATPPSCTTSARSRCRTRSSTSRAARPGRVGLHPPPHDRRRAHRGRRAGPQPGGDARAREPRALGRRRLPRRAGGRRHPARRPHRRRGRRLRRHDGRSAPTAPRAARRRRSPSCAAAAARSSTRWS